MSQELREYGVSSKREGPQYRHQKQVKSNEIDHFKGNFRDKHSNIILRSLTSENLLPLHTIPAGIVLTGRELKILLLKIIT